jgi:hypothetical protein
MVAAVATLEPAQAANTAQEAMLLWISPPGMKTSQRERTLYIPSAIPLRRTSSPIRMNNGMASRTKLVLPLPRPVAHDVPQVGVADVEELHDDERQCAQRPSDIYAAHKEGAHHSECCADCHRCYSSRAMPMQGSYTESDLEPVGSPPWIAASGITVTLEL